MRYEAENARLCEFGKVRTLNEIGGNNGAILCTKPEGRLYFLELKLGCSGKVGRKSARLAHIIFYAILCPTILVKDLLRWIVFSDVQLYSVLLTRLAEAAYDSSF